MALFDVDRSGDVLTVVPVGDLVPRNPGDLGLARLLEPRGGVRSVFIDLHRVDEINLEAIGEVLSLHIKLRDEGVDLSVRGARDAVKRRLTICGVMSLLSGPED